MTTTDTTREESTTMQSQVQLALLLAREHRAADIARAADARRFAVERSSIRRSVGRRVIAVGRRIAAEPPLELARSR
jgi:hypothetical protein